MTTDQQLDNGANSAPAAETTTIRPVDVANDNEPSWPKPIAEFAFHGLVGQFVKLIENRTEADQNALLVLALAQCGNRTGRGRFVEIGADRHCGNLFAAIVGPTSTGRKSSAISLVLKLLNRKELGHLRNQVISGLSTGEGLIYFVRDGGGINPNTGQRDLGVADKRLLIRESEFGRVLKVMSRQGNTLSPVLRDGWDHGDLSVLTKTHPVKATAAHLSLAVATTIEELLYLVGKDDIEGGLCNRFLWCCSRRSKALPEGGLLVGEDLTEILDAIDSVLEMALLDDAPLALSAEAQRYWGLNSSSHEGLYATLTAERDGRWGQVTARGAPMVLRLALIYAVMDYSDVIELDHLLAAAEVWRYADDSARFIFGSSGTGNYLADVILPELVRAGVKGMTRTEISKFLGHNSKADSVAKALNHLMIRGHARKRTPDSAGALGRPAEIWVAVT